MQKEYQLAVDIEKKILTPSFEVNTLDLKTIKLKITITKGMTLVDLTDITVRMSIRKPDGNVIFQDCQVTNTKGGQVEIILENQAYVMPGSYSAEIMCFKGADKVAVTGSFSYRSIRGIMDDKAIESKSEFTAITGMIKDTQETIEDLRKNGTGVDAQARQEVEQVSSQLVDIASVNVKSPPDGLVPLKGSNQVSDNDTTSLAALMDYAETNEVALTIPIGDYRITDNVLKTTKAKRGFSVKGMGLLNKSVFRFYPSESLKEFLTLIGSKYGYYSDFEISGDVSKPEGSRLGVGIALYSTEPTINNVFNNITIQRLKKGMYLHGVNTIINTFYNVKTQSNDIGLEVDAGENVFIRSVHEMNKVGVNIISGNLLFVGPMIEGNTEKGMHIQSGNVTLIKPYFELNHGLSLEIGTPTSKAGNIRISDFDFSDRTNDKMIIRNAKRVILENGTMPYWAADLQILSDVDYIEVNNVFRKPTAKQYFFMYINESKHKIKQKSLIYNVPMSKKDNGTFASGGYLDNITQSIKLALRNYTSEIVDDKMVLTATDGTTSKGFDIQLQPVHKDKNHVTVKIKLEYDTSTYTNLDNLYYNIEPRLHYTDTNKVQKYVNIGEVSGESHRAWYEELEEKKLTLCVKIPIKDFYSTLTDFGSFNYINLRIGTMLSNKAEPGSQIHIYQISIFDGCDESEIFNNTTDEIVLLNSPLIHEDGRLFGLKVVNGAITAVQFES